MGSAWALQDTSKVAESYQATFDPRAFEGGALAPAEFETGPGDFVYLPAHTAHRVEVLEFSTSVSLNFIDAANAAAAAAAIREDASMQCDGAKQACLLALL